MAGFGKLDWDQWLYGLFAGFIGGGAGAVVSGITVGLSDPKDYNLQSSKFYLLVLTIFVANGLMNAFMFLKQKPLPEIKEVQTVQVTKPPFEPATVVTTVEKTKITPAADVKEEPKK